MADQDPMVAAAQSRGSIVTDQHPADYIELVEAMRIRDEAVASMTTRLERWREELTTSERAHADEAEFYRVEMNKLAGRRDQLQAIVGGVERTLSTNAALPYPNVEVSLLALVAERDALRSILHRLVEFGAGNVIDDVLYLSPQEYDESVRVEGLTSAELAMLADLVSSERFRPTEEADRA